MEVKNTSNLPPGFRFHPTDEELIMYYLKNQATSKPCPVSIIPEVDIYKFDPWELPEKAEFGENEWYFFSPRDRKYPNGVRPNRATVSGYWKATGTDKAINSGSKYVGVKKALVFYKGKPPRGIKTDWIMHEYRLNGARKQPNKQNGSMRLDDWVLCRIYKKRPTGRVLEEKIDDSRTQLMGISTTANDDVAAAAAAHEQQLLKFPRTCSLSHLLEFEYLGSITQLLSDNPYNSTFDFPNATNSIGIDHHRGSSERSIQFGEMPYQSADSTKFQANQSSILNQPLFGNSVYGFQ